MSLAPLPDVEALARDYPEKFVPEPVIFGSIHRGDRIFIHTGCAEPQYLVQAMTEFVESNPKAFYDTELYQIWSFGVAPYTARKFQRNFRANSFFIGQRSRDDVNEGLADYTPIFFSNVPDVFRRGLIEFDVALIQVSPPDAHGYMSLGISVDIVKAALETTRTIIAQINPNMPRVHGDGFIHITEVDYALVHEEPLLPYPIPEHNETFDRIGEYVSQIVEDGDTIQVGYGAIPNAVLHHLYGKKHLGIHTELISDGIAELIRRGVVDNSRKTLNRGKAVASFCMGSQDTYEFLHDNPAIEFRTVDFTNNPLVIARQENMVAINSCLQMDLTGQATATSLGTFFYSGIGGQADFMRGAVLSPGGKTILTFPSTADDGTISRIVPALSEGAGCTITQGDIYYVVTEYGIAYLHGKNVRERAMDLIAIAHPRFRPQLIQEAKKRNLIYQDQAYLPGKRGQYPEHLETFRTTKSGLGVRLRPVKISDEPLLKEFFYSLSDRSMYRRFISSRRDMPHERLQEYVVIDWTRECVILAVEEEEGKETVAGVGQYGIAEDAHTAEIAFVVRDDYQNQGVGSLLLQYLTTLAKRQGLLGFTAEVLVENRPMLHLFENMGFDIEKRGAEGVLELKMAFREEPRKKNESK